MKHLFSIAALAALSSGCVLAESADNFPFEPLIVINTRDMGSDNGTGGPVDMTPPPPPLLVFTEILIDSPGTEMFLQERGEYIEIKNIGEGAADPRGITIFLEDPLNDAASARIEVPAPFTEEERAAVDALRPILPDQYFVFVRYENDAVPLSTVVPPGALYDYGKFARGPSLPHSATQVRELHLGYRFPNGAAQTFDTLRWDGRVLVAPNGNTEGGVSIEEGMALSVDVESEDPVLNDDPEQWCVPPTRVGDVNGSPAESVRCP